MPFFKLNPRYNSAPIDDDRSHGLIALGTVSSLALPISGIALPGGVNGLVTAIVDNQGNQLNSSGGNLMVNVSNFAIGSFGDVDTTPSNLTSSLAFSEGLLYDPNLNKWVRARGDTTDGAWVNVKASSAATNPMNLVIYDYVSMVESPAGTETYTFKTGGSGGTTTNTVVIVYTDATKTTISTVTKT